MSLGQLSFSNNGEIKDKVQRAIDRLRAFEPEEGYYLAFSGGKDSQCIYHLAKMAGVKFDAHYSVTSVDPPELVQFIKKNYPDAWEGRVHQYRKDGTPYTMWNLIPEKKFPPTAVVRYCCDKLKEQAGFGRVVLTGVRWSESASRSKTQGVVVVRSGGQKKEWITSQIDASFGMSTKNAVVLNDDNEESRKIVEHCFRKQRTTVNPIVDWSDEDVWQFLNENGIEHCSLYDEGFDRLGCVGCPISGRKRMQIEFERWPKYKQLYLHAFERLLDVRFEKYGEKGKIQFEDADSVFKWWISNGRS